MAVFDVNEFLNRVKAANPDLVPDDVEKEVRGGFLRQDDYNRRLETEVKPAKEKYERAYNENVQWRQSRESRLRLLDKAQESGFDLEEWVNDNGRSGRDRETDDAADSRLKALLERQAGELEELRGAVKQLGLGVVELPTFMTEAAQVYQSQFGKSFNPREFRKWYDEKFRAGDVASLKEGFELYIKPEVEAKEKADREAWEKAERTKIREEERQSLFEKHGAPPIDHQPAGSSFFSHQREAAKSGDDKPPQRLSRAERARKFGESYARHEAAERAQRGDKSA